MTSTNHDILNALQLQIAAFMVAQGYGSGVYITDAPMEETAHAFAVQIVPTGETASHPISGVGLIRSTVNIVTWWRNVMDPVGRGTRKIAGPSGILPFVEGLRQNLIQSNPGNFVSIRLTFRSGGQAQTPDGEGGWVTVTDSYEYGYEIPWGGA